MKIHNVRLGHANNSSSSHSLLLLNPGVKDVRSRGAEGGDFGWNFFTAASSEDKAMYLAVTLEQQLCHELGDFAGRAVTKEILGINMEKDMYVDHQSTLMMPRYFTGDFGRRKGVHVEFVRALDQFLMRSDVVILGGNDNTDEKHPLASKGREVLEFIPREESSENFIARQDDQGYWVLFNKQTGAKVRFSFADPTDTFQPDRSSAPELVDLKITDHCTFGCRFCYQGSTGDGKHGDKARIIQLISDLADLEVLELAIGGGEPTLYPGFEGLLKNAKAHDINVNFTTRNLKWLESADQTAGIMEGARTFAFSVHSPYEVQQLNTLLVKRDLEHRGVTAQVVMGTLGIDEIVQILEYAGECHMGVTLLGYKTTGRGLDYLRENKQYNQRYNYHDREVFDQIVKAARKHRVRLCIDTVLAASWQKFLKSAGIRDKTYYTEEGRYSCYIDASGATPLIGPSSYCGVGEMQRIERHGSNELKSLYQQFNRQEDA